MENFTKPTFSLTGLCGRKHYSFVVRATDIVNNVMGQFSRPYTFQTADGIPSSPHDVRFEFKTNSDKSAEVTLTILWEEPTTTNGNLIMYEILWSNTNINNCDEAYMLCNQDIRGVHGCVNTSNLNDRVYNTVESAAFFESILVCVRAYTSSGKSEWESKYNGQVIIGALSTPVSERDDCNGLIAVAVIASFAVVSSIVMGIILAVVICKTRDSLCDYFGRSEDEKYKNETLPPGYNRTASMQSTKSLISRNGNGK